MTYLEAIFKVLVVGLVLGAGLPAIFAVGLVAFSKGSGDDGLDGGAVAAPNPALKALGLLAVRARRRGGRHRDPVHHQGDDHPPLRVQSRSLPPG